MLLYGSSVLTSTGLAYQRVVYKLKRTCSLYIYLDDRFVLVQLLERQTYLEIFFS